MVHKPKHRVHSFRGLLSDGGQDEINLERQNLNLAYRVVKFEVMAEAPGLASYESVVKIYREKQTSLLTENALVNFTEPDLLGAAVYIANSSISAYTMITIFDNTLFSRNIYVTHTDNNDSNNCNYYIEIEEVPVGAATLMQLKLSVARKLNLQQD